MNIIERVRSLLRRTPPALDGEIIEPMPIGPGWTPWLYEAPPRNSGPVEIWRREWYAWRTIDPADMAPEMNVAGLYWRTPSGA